MKIMVKDIFRAYYMARNEADESIAEGHRGSCASYGQLLLRRSDLSGLLESCELEIEVPPRIASSIIEEVLH